MKIRKKQAGGSIHRRRLIEFSLFALPWIIGFLAFQLYPLAQSFQISVSLLHVTRAGVQWIPDGFRNYRQVFTGPTKFLPELLQAIILTLTQIPLVLCFALAAAALMKQPLIGNTLFRGLFFLPVVVGSSAVINQLFAGGSSYSAGSIPLVVVGPFLADIVKVLGPTLGNDIVEIFQHLSLVMWQSGVQTLLFLAGLYSVSQTYYEVARIDGANAWQTFLKVTLPSISPVILLAMVYSMVSFFTEPILNPLVNTITNEMFGQSSNGIGIAGAMGWVYFVAMFVVVAIVFRIAQRHVFYAGER